MSVLQVWLIAGIPALVIGVMLFIAASQFANLLGYVVLGAGFAIVASVDRASGAVFGAVLALLYATGRGHVPPSGGGPDVVPDVVSDSGHGHVAAGDRTSTGA